MVCSFQQLLQANFTALHKGSGCLQLHSTTHQDQFFLGSPDFVWKTSEVGNLLMGLTYMINSIALSCSAMRLAQVAYIKMRKFSCFYTLQKIFVLPIHTTCSHQQFTSLKWFTCSETPQLQSFTDTFAGCIHHIIPVSFTTAISSDCYKTLNCISTPDVCQFKSCQIMKKPNPKPKPSIQFHFSSLRSSGWQDGKAF